jgi:hypothetical protein
MHVLVDLLRTMEESRAELEDPSRKPNSPRSDDQEKEDGENNDETPEERSSEKKSGEDQDRTSDHPKADAPNSTTAMSTSVNTESARVHEEGNLTFPQRVSAFLVFLLLSFNIHNTTASRPTLTLPHTP